MASEEMLDLAGLRLLDAVTRRGSMTAAARALGVSQQAASLRMRALERQVGVPLLIRSAGGSRLTPAGARLHERSGALLADARELAAFVADLRANRDAQLRIASSLTIAEQLLPRWLVAFADRPRVRRTEVELTAINTDAVVARVRAGLADVGFVEGPAAPTGLRARAIAHDELLLVVRPDHRWARRRARLPVEELVATALVSREAGSGTRQSFDQALATVRAPVTAAPALEVTTAAAVRSAVAAGAGPAVISSLAVADDVRLGRLRAVRVANLPLRRTLRAIWRGDSRPPAGPVRELLAIAAADQR